MRNGDTFLTSLGTDVYEGFNSYTNDQGTSQSTVLLQKRKKMQEVQLELDRKKQEYEERMRRCKAKEVRIILLQRVESRKEILFWLTLHYWRDTLMMKPIDFCFQ